MNSLVALDCVDSAFCMTLTNRGYVVIKGSIQTERQAFDHNWFLSGLSCTARDFCIALDRGGNSYTWDGAAWTGPHHIPAESYLRVSCSSPGFCVAISAEGDALHRVDRAWRAPRIVLTPGGSIEDVACDSPQLCVLVDRHGAAAAYTGSSWTTPRRVSPTASALEHVTCAGGSFCAAADSHGNVQFRRHGHWSDPEAATVRPTAGPSGNRTAVWRAGTNSLEGKSDAGATPLSCVSLTFCMGLGGSMLTRRCGSTARPAAGPDGVRIHTRPRHLVWIHDILRRR